MKIKTMSKSGISFIVALIALPILILPEASFSAISLQRDVLIKGQSNSAVYYLASDDKRYVFPSEKVYKSWFTNFDGVVEVTDEELASFRLGGNVTYRPGIRMVKITTDPKVYAVGKGGALRWITSEAIANSLFGANWNKNVDDIPDAFFVNYQIGSAINLTSDFNPTSEAQAVDTIAADKDLIISFGARRSDTSSDIGDAQTVPFEFDPVLSNAEIIKKVSSAVVMPYFVQTTASGKIRTAGSGTIISIDGYVLTNAHVTRLNLDETSAVYLSEMSVYVPDLGTFTAQVVGRNDDADIAILKLPAISGGWPFVIPETYTPISAGDDTFVLGYPLTLSVIDSGFNFGDPSFKEGTVSRLVDRNGITYVETSAEIHPGNSGGALVNNRGRLVGIPTSAVAQLVIEGITIGETIKFAIYYDSVSTYIPALKSGTDQRKFISGSFVSTPDTTPLPEQIPSPATQSRFTSDARVILTEQNPFHIQFTADIADAPYWGVKCWGGNYPDGVWYSKANYSGVPMSLREQENGLIPGDYSCTLYLNLNSTPVSGVYSGGNASTTIIIAEDELGNPITKTLNFTVPVPLPTVPGVMNYELSPNDTESSAGLVISGQSGVVLAKFRLSATNEEMKLTKARISLVDSSVSSNISTLSLYDGATLVAGPSSMNASGEVDFAGFEFVISKDASKTLAVKATLTQIGSGAVSGSNIKIRLIDGDVAPGTYEVRGTVTSTVLTGFGSSGDDSIVGNSKIVRKTKPTISLASLPTTTLTNGSTVVSRVTFTADSAKQVAVKAIIWTISRSGGIGITAPVVREVGSTSISLSSGLSDSTDSDCDAGDSGACKVVTVFSSEQIIPAGTSKTFELVVTSDTVGSNDAMTTSIVSDNSLVTGSLSNAGTADGDSVNGTKYNFIWSDNSAVPHMDSVGNSSDWTNGYYTKVLPTDAQTVLAP